MAIYTGRWSLLSDDTGRWSLLSVTSEHYRKADDTVCRHEREFAYTAESLVCT